MKDTWRAGLKSLEVERNVANLHHYAERSRHHTKDKQRLVLSVVAYDSLPGHHSGSIGRSVHFARVWTAISRGLRRGCKMAVGPRRLTPQQIFKAAQQPALWLISAEALRDAAEVIIKREDDYLVPYLRAHDEAVNVAMSIACAEGEK